MRILFIGTVLSSLRFLTSLLDMKANIVGVITKKASPYNSDFSDISPLCLQHSIPVKYSADINQEDVLEWAESLHPDIIFCFGYSELLKSDILQLAPLGVVGFHPAKLPKNRGRHPIIWALALGLEETSSTFFFMDEGADSGEILNQKDISITYEDNALSLYSKIIDTGISQLRKIVPDLAHRTFTSIPQDHSLANYWRKRSPQDGKIDFRMSSRAIYNLVRALARPYPGAHLEYLGQDVKIWKVIELPQDSHNIESGKILRSNSDCIEVKCYDGAIRIVEHEFSDLPQPGEYL